MEGYESEEAPQQSTVIDISLGRHGTPRGSDGEVNHHDFVPFTVELTRFIALSAQAPKFPRY